MGSFKSAMDANDTAKATEVVDEIVELNDASISQNVPLMRFAIAIKTGDGEAASKHGMEILEMTKTMEDKSRASMIMNHYALNLCNAAEVERIDHSVAVALAESASAIAEETNPRFLETLARAKFVAGDQEGAISSQESAIKLTGNAQRKAKLEESLGAYQDGNLPPAPGR